MVEHFLSAYRDINYHEDGIAWLFPPDEESGEPLVESSWEFLGYSEDRQREMVTNRLRTIVRDRMKSRLMNRRGIINPQVNGLFYFDYLRKCADEVIENTKWEVEVTEGTLRVRFFEFVPTRADMKHWLFLSVDGEDEQFGNIASHWHVEPHKLKLTAQASLRDESRTRRSCPKCLIVVNPNTEMFTVEVDNNYRPEKVCMPCLTYFHDFYDLNTGRFRYVGVDAEVTEWDVSDIRVQDRRNLQRFNLMEWLSDKVGELPFIPNNRHEDYSYELNWSYWTTDSNGQRVAIPSDRYGNSIQTDRTHESKEYAKEGIPLGMELEVQYRQTDRPLSAGITEFLNPLHKDFPYGYERLRTQRNQLAVGTYDTSTGRHGMEFKFQPMSWEFLKTLPDEFFTTLQSEFRGYHAKRCGIHLNIPKSVLSTGQFWFFIAWHNMALYNFMHTPEDDGDNLLGDIYQRVDVDYAKWSYLSDPIFESPDTRCCDFHSLNDTKVNIACATTRYLRSNRWNGIRNSWINLSNGERVEVRAFASNTMKDRLVKNFQFLEALLLYSDAVTFNYVPDLHNHHGINSDIESAFNGSPAEFQMVLNMLDEDMFIRWLLMTGLDNKFTELITYLDRQGHLERVSNNTERNSQIENDLRTVVQYS